MRESHDPLVQFAIWYQQALEAAELDPDAMTLATATCQGKPSARIVLYKGITQGGFLIYTNYTSQKALELQANPLAAAVIYWPRCYRQVRIEGEMQKITSAESAQYFQSRPRESQIAANISPQSQEIPNRDYLVACYAKFAAEHSTGAIPCPDFWGGFRLMPQKLEFWQGQAHRLHDRLCYYKKPTGWEVIRLAP